MTSEINWAEHFGPVLGVNRITDARYASYVPPGYTYADSPYAHRVYLDKLPSTPEGCRLYIYQSFSELVRKLDQESVELAKTAFRRGTEREYSPSRDGYNVPYHLSIAVNELSIALAPPRVLSESSLTFGGIPDLPKLNTSDGWVTRNFYSLLQNRTYIRSLSNIGTKNLPERMIFWEPSIRPDLS